MFDIVTFQFNYIIFSIFSSLVVARRNIHQQGGIIWWHVALNLVKKMGYEA